jgi:hypothetical protein
MEHHPTAIGRELRGGIGFRPGDLKRAEQRRVSCADPPLLGDRDRSDRAGWRLARFSSAAATIMPRWSMECGGIYDRSPTWAAFPSGPIGAVPDTAIQRPERTARLKSISGSNGDPDETREAHAFVPDRGDRRRATARRHHRRERLAIPLCGSGGASHPEAIPNPRRTSLQREMRHRRTARLSRLHGRAARDGDSRQYEQVCIKLVP